LLHDISHTAFSHAGDYVFTRKTLKDSYQDDIHAWYLKTAGIDNVLQKHGISFESVLYKSGSCSMLEQELPDICADRLEYNLQGGLCEKILTPEDVDMILMDLSFSGGRWYFKTLAVAKKFAPVSLHLTQNVWGSPVAHCMSAFFVMALKRAIEIGLVSRDDMHFGVDNDIWEKLSASDDEKIKTYMAMTIKAPVLAFTQHCPGDSTITFSAKFRGIDPWVMTDAGLKRLTAIDSGFKTSFDLVAQKVACCQVGIPHSFLKQRELLEALRSS
jgi:HD superfamily phosphohydrolase